MTQKQQFGMPVKRQWIALGVMFLFPFIMLALQRAVVHWLGTVRPVLAGWHYIVLFGLFMLSVVAYILYVVQPLLGRMTRIGLAWHIGRRQKQDVLWHNGATGGYYSFMAIMPAERAGIVVLSNCNKPVERIGLKALAAVSAR
jgi:CubicO group peptidase (beta-lactamase class C family)